MEKLLKNSPYFNNLNDEEIKKLHEIIIEKEYRKGEIIFFEGEQGEGLFIIKSGKVKFVKMTEDGKEQILHILKKGDIFAEVVLFDDVGYPATAVAMEKTKVGLVKSIEMEKLILKESGIGIKIMKEINKRLRRAQEKIRNFGLKNTSSRLAHILIYLVEEYGKNREDKIQIQLNLTQEDLANMIGASRETVSRILNEFERAELISTSRKKLVINDFKKLEEMV